MSMASPERTEMAKKDGKTVATETSPCVVSHIAEDYPRLLHRSMTGFQEHPE